MTGEWLTERTAEPWVPDPESRLQPTRDSADVTVTRSGELMVAAVEGASERGVEFVDAWFPKRKDAEFEVVDSGHVIIHERDIDELVREAKAEGLTVEVESCP